MSLSPLPKKGSFSNHINSLTNHRRAASFKILKKSISKASDIVEDQTNDTEKIMKLESTLKNTKDELIFVKTKNSHLQKKFKILQTKYSKILGDSCGDVDVAINSIYNIQCESLKLIDFLFESLEKAYNASLNLRYDEDLELKLIKNFQKFQSKTQINSSGYIKKVMGWRHKFTDDLISPADSLKNSMTAAKKNYRSVSSIIASTIKVYAVGLIDFNGSSPLDIKFRKGEIIEIISTNGKICEGRIGDRQGTFPEQYVKIV